MFNFQLPSFFEIFSVYGLIGLAALLLLMLTRKFRSTAFSWALSFILGFIAAYCIEFFSEIGLLMAFGEIPSQFWSVAPYLATAIASVWVSGSAMPSRWPIFIPCVIFAGLALQHGVRFSDAASITASVITLAVGATCWFIVPREFSSNTVREANDF
jgi:hypothetical protein